MNHFELGAQSTTATTSMEMEDDRFTDSGITDTYSSDGHDQMEDDSEIIEELTTQEDFDIDVKRNVLTSTDPSETLADRLDKILTPSKNFTVSFSDDSF